MEKFYGQFTHNVDDKGRITIPAKYRARLAGGAVVTRGLDGCLLLYPLDVWDASADKISHQSMTAPKARNLRRWLLAEASDDVPDKQGRVLIPPRLLAYAKIDREAVVVGQHDYCEIWNPDGWKQCQEQGESALAADANLFEGVDL
jgi:MraZ protein